MFQINEKRRFRADWGYGEDHKVALAVIPDFEQFSETVEEIHEDASFVTAINAWDWVLNSVTENFNLLSQ